MNPKVLLFVAFGVVIQIIWLVLSCLAIHVLRNVGRR